MKEEKKTTYFQKIKKIKKILRKLKENENFILQMLYSYLLQMQTNQMSHLGPTLFSFGW